jgi:integrase
VWLTQFGALTRKGMPNIVAKRATIAGIKMHPHMLRHSWADRLKTAGMSDEDVMKLGGWTSTTVMMRYGSARAEARALARYDELSPLSDL